jgi:hypothetical protein
LGRRVCCSGETYPAQKGNNSPSEYRFLQLTFIPRRG